MKSNNRKILITFYIIFLINCKSKQDDLEVLEQSEEKQDSIQEPDRELERIRESMYEIASNMMKKSDLHKKKMLIGELPDGYPIAMKENAKLVRQDRSIWDPVMQYPTAIWRMCLYPTFKINYTTWCRQKYALTKTKIKVNGCLNNFCTVCCDHLQYQYKDIADNNDVGEKLLLGDKRGFESIKYIVTNSEIDECRNTCKKHYKIEMPIIMPTPPRDPTLGVEISNPAISCADIKKWGNEQSKSGEYWLELSSKGKHKTFCDMETDGGGWTLFYNYIHLPGQELNLDSSKMPSNLKDNSHMHLSDGGFTNKDIKEIRFFCTEKFQGDKIYWHFKTKNEDVIKTSLTGDQQNLRIDSISDSYQELQPPFQINGVYKKRIFESMAETIDFAGSNTKGGFTLTPFGSRRYGGYWTIKGPSLNNPKYECATQHEYVGGYSSPESSPNMVETHHSIWFRGDPPKEELVQRRLLGRMKNDPS